MKRTTIETLTDRQITALCNEAINAGDVEMAETCDLALDMSADATERDAARRSVVEAINYAEAQQ